MKIKPKWLYLVGVRGKADVWGIVTYLTEEAAADMKADGLDIVALENRIPAWVAESPLAPFYVWLQDAWNFKWLRRGKP